MVKLGTGHPPVQTAAGQGAGLVMGPLLVAVERILEAIVAQGLVQMCATSVGKKVTGQASALCAENHFLHMCKASSCSNRNIMGAPMACTHSTLFTL